jgi:three-Cys-motif partner protein
MRCSGISEASAILDNWESRMLKYDNIGYWSEIKLDMIKEYAKAYSTILSAQKGFHHIYIDAFAGAGYHISRTTGEMVAGSPVNALKVEPPFKEYYFIDLDKSKAAELQKIAQEQSNVFVFEGDCNDILLNEVFPKVRYKDYRRALCLLDPYGLHLDWNIIRTAGQMGTIEIFLNFPVADINRNVLWRNPEKVSPEQLKRWTRLWGDDSWKPVAYDTQRNLFGFEEKTDTKSVVDAFRKRLKDAAGFAYVPEPIPMRNTHGAVVYYLFFASPKPVAAKIVKHIFDKYRDKMA